MGRRHPVSQEAGYSAAVLVVTLAYGQRNALTRRDDALRRPGGTGTFQSVGAAGRPAPSSFKIPALTRVPLAVSLAHARAFNKRPYGRLQEWGQVQNLQCCRFCTCPHSCS